MVKKRTVKTVQDILQYIDEAMKENDIPRSLVEKSTFLSRGAFSRWVKGTFIPTTDRIMDVLNFMDIEVALKCNNKCPKFLNQSDVILDSKLLEQKIRERLNYQLEGETARLLKDVLFSDNVTLDEKKKIHQMLGYLIAVEEMKEM